MTDTTIILMRKDLKHDQEVLQAKRTLVRILAQLPDDDARRRVIGAVGVLYGTFDVIPKP